MIGFIVVLDILRRDLRFLLRLASNEHRRTKVRIVSFISEEVCRTIDSFTMVITTLYSARYSELEYKFLDKFYNSMGVASKVSHIR